MNGMLHSMMCVDASFVLRLLGSTSPEAAPAQMWLESQEQGKIAVAPGLLYYEVANALHRYVVKDQLTAAAARQLLELALDLEIEVYSEPDLHYQALRLAQELALPAAYDAHYLALAKRLGAELWTADQRLARVAGTVVAIVVVP
ncbi:MAG: type II toxin-antitoxin system VapC family toxin [Desulfobacca sp.]|uniref:type II toxin-antitoxin system VapC family toxin n=1 Tax=Desulfobacca sp. TaxID=2067990 RepID=UPI00404AC288